MHSISITGNPNLVGQFIRSSCTMYNLTSRKFMGVTLTKELQLPFELKFVTNHSVVIIELCSVDMISVGFYVLNIQHSTFLYYPGTCRILLTEPMFELDSIPHTLEYSAIEVDTVLPIPCVLSRLPVMQSVRVRIDSIAYDLETALELVKKFHKSPRFVRDIYYLVVVYQDYFYEQHYLLHNITSLISIPERAHLFVVVESTYEQVNELDKTDFRILLGWTALSLEQSNSKLLQSKTPFPFEAHPLSSYIQVQLHYLYNIEDSASKSPIVRKRSMKRKPSFEPIKEAPILDKTISFIESKPLQSVFVDQMDSPLPFDRNDSLEMTQQLESPLPSKAHPIAASDSLELSKDPSNTTSNEFLKAYSKDNSNEFVKSPENISDQSGDSDDKIAKPSYLYDLHPKREMENKTNVIDRDSDSEELTSIIDISKVAYNKIAIQKGIVSHSSIVDILPQNSILSVHIKSSAIVFINNQVLYKAPYEFECNFIPSELLVHIILVNEHFDPLKTISYELKLNKPCFIELEGILITIGSQCTVQSDIIKTPVKRQDSQFSSIIDLNYLINIPKITHVDIINAQRSSNSFELSGFVLFGQQIFVEGSIAESSLKNIASDKGLHYEGTQPLYCEPFYETNSLSSNLPFISLKPFHLQVDDFKLNYNLKPCFTMNCITIKFVYMTERDSITFNGQFDNQVFYKSSINEHKLFKHLFTQPILISAVISDVIEVFVIKLAKLKSMQIVPSQLYLEESIAIQDKELTLKNIKLINSSTRIQLTVFPLEFIDLELHLKTKKCKLFQLKPKLQRKVIQTNIENTIYQQ